MKQNERILVYLVTGFLAVILVVAVFFGREGNAAGKPETGEQVRGLGQILDQKPVSDPGEESKKPEEGVPPKIDPKTDPKPGEDDEAGKQPEAGEQELGAQVPGGQAPLVATLPVPAAQRLVELFGESRRDRTVRIARARSGDSLESMVRRWCGKRDPFLEEAKSLNEDLTILRVGQEVVVPWVEPDLVVAAYEARQPRLLTGEASRPNPAILSGNSPSGSDGPTFQVPGGEPKSVVAPAGGTQVYIVKPNDSLWKIAARHFGNSKADAMIREIRKLNPGLKGDTVHPQQKLVLPTGT